MLDMKDVKALRKARFFKSLTDRDLARVARVGQMRRFRPEEALAERGSDPERCGLFVILSGTATVEAGGDTYELSPGDFFGEMALLGRTRRSASVTAREPVDAWSSRRSTSTPSSCRAPAWRWRSYME
jgi:CRP-like cAMP-binding protein